jgi:hypothetical protein
MALRPSKTTQKALISTTSRFIGEYEKDGILLTHAWSNLTKPLESFKFSLRLSENPASRSAFIFAFETEPIDETEPIEKKMVNLSKVDLICAYLSVLFGKRFDNHGLIESIGAFHVPNLAQFGDLCDDRLPQNSHKPRDDFSIPLDLREFSRIERFFLDDTLDQKFLRTFQGSAKFYLQALQSVEHDPEVAYLHLITAGEILSNFYEYKKDQLLDAHTTQILEKIRNDLSDGEQVANFISGKLRQIKKRFVKTIMQLVDPVFFQRSEDSGACGKFKVDSFETSISAAYDLRSRYVHTGISFGYWVFYTSSEVQIVQPIVADKEFGKILKKAPTYAGLERVIRYCLLRFAQSNGAYIEPSVDPESNSP